MPTRTGNAQWNGGLKDGNGTVSTPNNFINGQYSFSSRFEEGDGTNPEELLATAHAACFSMAFSGGLEAAGFTAVSVRTEAKVHIEKGEAGFSITKIDLITNAEVPGIEEAQFQEIAEEKKKGCPVSQALASVEMTLAATLNA
ncbi:MAG: OsmC family protein [Bacteroidetes bacterium]|nr:OsmC family protein [Bacteroidota bacterium]